MPTDQPDQTEPRDATDALRRGFDQDLAGERPSFLDEQLREVRVRDTDDPLRRGLAAALIASRTDEENQ